METASVLFMLLQLVAWLLSTRRRIVPRARCRFVAYCMRHYYAQTMRNASSNYIYIQLTDKHKQTHSISTPQDREHGSSVENSLPGDHEVKKVAQPAASLRRGNRQRRHLWGQM